MDWFVGIDPGGQGALCSLDLDDPDNPAITFCDIPPKLHSHKFYGWLKSNLSDTQLIGIEDVHSLPGMSAKSNFSFGRNLGMVLAVLAVDTRPIVKVPPKRWQKTCGVIFPKGTVSATRKHITAVRALELYPEAKLYGPRGGLIDGRADALMIAHYMRITYGQDSATS